MGGTPTPEAPPTFDAPDALDAPTAGSRAIRGSGVRVAGYLVGALLTLASAPLLVRHLGTVEFGRYMLVVSLAALVGGVTDAGLTAVAVREYSVRQGAARDAFMRQVLGARIVLTLAGMLIATGFALMAGYGGDLVLGTLLAGAGLLVGVVTSTLGIPLAAELRLGWLTLTDLAGRLLGVLLVVGLVLASAGIVAFLAVPIPAGIAVLVLTVFLVRGKVPLRPSLHFGELLALMRETLPLAVATILSTLYARVVIIVTSLLASGLTLGYFSTAARVVEVGIGIPLALVGTTFPILARAARDDHARLRYVLQRLFEVALLVGTWMALVTALAARPIALLLGGTEALPAVPILRILALALLAVFLNATWQHCLLALHRHRDMLVANAIGLGLIVVLAVALVPTLGGEGAALAVVLGEGVLTLASAYFLLRAHPDLRPSAWIVPRVLGALGVALLLAAIAPDPRAELGTVLATLGYFGTLLALGAIPPEFREAVVSRLRPAAAT